MNDNNGFLSALGAVAIVGLIAGFIMALIPRGLTTTDIAWAAIGNGVLQLGVVSTIGWLIVRAIIAQLLYKPAEQRRAEDSAKRSESRGS